MNILAPALPDALAISLHPAILNLLVNNIAAIGYSTVVIVSVNVLYSLLSNERYHDLAFKLARNTSFPSYAYMSHNDIQNVTTTWETWDISPRSARISFNHHTFNSIGAWFYRNLAGIQSNALRTITIYPRMPMSKWKWLLSKDQLK